MGFNYRQYLASILLNPASSSEDRATAVDELKRRADIHATGCALGYTSFAAIVAASIANLLLDFAHGEHPTWVSSIGSAIAAALWGVAWFSTGSISGFLFGIPKIMQPDRSSTSVATTGAKANQHYQQQVNTNLEQISDWLTKIIVGLGLVQLRRIPEYVDRVASYMTGEHCGIACKPLACAILMSFFVLGFLTGYLFTRMFLAPAFSRADQGGQANAIQTITNKPAGPGSGVSLGHERTSPPDAVTKAAIASVSSIPVTADAPIDQRWAMAKAKLFQGDYVGAKNDYARLVQDSPNNIAIRLEYAWALFQIQHNWTPLIQEQLDAAIKIHHTPGTELEKQLYESLTFYGLYREPNGADDTIRLAQEYVNNPVNLESAEIFLNLACAYGQKAKKQEKVPPEIREMAFNAAKRAIELDPRMAPILRKQMEGSDAVENDLYAFAKDPEFRRLVGLPPLKNSPK